MHVNIKDLLRVQNNSNKKKKKMIKDIIDTEQVTLLIESISDISMRFCMSGFIYSPKL